MTKEVRSPISVIESQRIADLVRAAASGDSRAWDALVGRFGPMVEAVARGHRLSPADVRDVAQTTWLRLFESLHRIESPERIGAWLATTARRESLRQLRRGDREFSTDDATFVSHASMAPAVDAGIVLDETRATVRRAFEGLPERAQTLLTLLLGDDRLTYKELSEQLDMPIGSIGPTRQRHLEALRRLIEAEDAVLAQGVA